VVDLTDGLVGFVRAVDKGQANVAGFHLKLSQDGIAKGFGRDASAVRNEKDCSMRHDCKLCDGRGRCVLKSDPLSTACWCTRVKSKNKQDSERWFWQQVPIF
jgi:hypothetical protein